MNKLDADVVKYLYRSSLGCGIPDLCTRCRALVGNKTAWEVLDQSAESGGWVYHVFMRYKQGEKLPV